MDDNRIGMEKSSQLEVNKKIIDEALKEFTIFSDEIAMLMGISESIIFSKLRGWLKFYTIEYENKGKFQDHYHGGKIWVYNSYKAWQKQMPYFNLKTIERGFLRLEKYGYILSGNFNKIRYDRTKWYTINEEPLIELSKLLMELPRPSRQNVVMVHDKMSSPIPKITNDISNKSISKEIASSKTSFKDNISDQCVYEGISKLKSSLPMNGMPVLSSERPINNRLSALSFKASIDNNLYSEGAQRKLTSQEIYEIYCECYLKFCGLNHPNIKARQIEKPDMANFINDYGFDFSYLGMVFDTYFNDKNRRSDGNYNAMNLKVFKAFYERANEGDRI